MTHVFIEKIMNLRLPEYKTWHTGMIEFGTIPILIAAIFYAPTWYWWTVPFTYFLCMGLGFRAGVHALFSHNAYECPNWWRWLLFYLSTITNDGPLPWIVASHRTHHKFAEGEHDPDHHSLFYRFNGKMAGQSKIRREMVTVMKDPFMRMALENHQLIVLFHILLCSLIALVVGDPWIIFFFWLLPAAMTIWAYDLNQGTAHLPGYPFNYRNFDTPDKSQNNLLQAILLCGEGLHNNHHQYPRMATYPVHWWEWFFDWPALFIWLIKKK